MRNRYRDAGRGGRLPDPGCKPLAALGKHVADALSLVDPDHLAGDRERVRLGPVRGGQEEDALVGTAQAAALHELAPPSERRDGEAVSQRLADRREVGQHGVHVLGATKVPAEPGDHLVEDEERAVG